MVPWFGRRIWVILQLTGAKRFGKQPRSYWILIQWPCDAYDTGGTGARGPVGIAIYLSPFSTDFMWYQFYLRLFIEHSRVHRVHGPMRAHSCVASLHRDRFKVVVWSQIVCHWHRNRKGWFNNERLMTSQRPADTWSYFRQPFHTHTGGHASQDMLHKCSQTRRGNYHTRTNAVGWGASWCWVKKSATLKGRRICNW